MTRAPYRSPLRAAAAARTRAAVLDAGLQTFAQRGYDAATVGQIAARAGVSVPTVYASVGGKRDLLLELCRQALASPDRGHALGQLETETDPELVLRHVVAGARALVERYSPVLQVAAHAQTVPEAHAYWEQGLTTTREVCAATARRLHDLDGLRPELDIEQATTTLSALIHPSTLHVLVDELGMSWDAAESWLEESCRRLLLRRGPADASPRG